MLQQTNKTSIKPIGNPDSATLAKAAIDSSQLGGSPSFWPRTSNLGCHTDRRGEDAMSAVFILLALNAVAGLRAMNGPNHNPERTGEVSRPFSHLAFIRS
jgi:hypothetical protein